MSWPTSSGRIKWEEPRFQLYGLGCGFLIERTGNTAPPLIRLTTRTTKGP